VFSPEAEKHPTTGRILRGIVHHSNFVRLTSGLGSQREENKRVDDGARQVSSYLETCLDRMRWHEGSKVVAHEDPYRKAIFLGRKIGSKFAQSEATTT